jgi:Ala-tRNA(Pro) deacylase
LSFGKADLLMEVLGIPAGSVTALALINDRENRVSVVIDAQLMHHDSINCHPLENTATTNIGRDDLIKFIRACGHDPKIAVLGTKWDSETVRHATPAAPAEGASSSGGGE